MLNATWPWPGSDIKVNPLCMHEGYGSRSVCVCVSVALLAASYIPHLYVKSKVTYGAFKICTVWLSLTMLHLRVLASFAGHHCLPHSRTTSQWTKDIAIASFQHEECAYLIIIRAN